MVISKSSGAGTVGATTDNGNGTYTATVTSPTVTGSGTFTGTLGGNPVTGSAVITYTPGAASATNSTISPVTASITADGVSTQVITVQARDANNNNLTTGGATVVINQSSGTGTVGATTDKGNGTYTATVTSPTVTGTGTFTATLGGSAVPGSSVITYTPGAATATNSTISPATASITADGVSTQVITVQARDAHNNNLTTGGSTVVINQSSGTGTVGATADKGNGTYTATVTSPTATGSGTFTATLGGSSVTGSAVITYIPGAKAKLQILLPGEVAAPGTVAGKTGTPSAQVAATPFSVTVNAVDANWNVVSSTDTVGITSSNSHSMPANAPLVAGSASFSVTLNTSAASTLTAGDVTNGSITANTSPSIAVTARALKQSLLPPIPKRTTVQTAPQQSQRSRRAALRQATRLTSSKPTTTRTWEAAML